MTRWRCSICCRRTSTQSEEHGRDACCIWNNISREAGISSESYGWTEHSTPSGHRLSVCFWFLVWVQAWLPTIFLESGGGASHLDFPKNCLFCHCIVKPHQFFHDVALKVRLNWLSTTSRQKCLQTEREREKNPHQLARQKPFPIQQIFTESSCHARVCVSVCSDVVKWLSRMSEKLNPWRCQWALFLRSISKVQEDLISQSNLWCHSCMSETAEVVQDTNWFIHHGYCPDNRVAHVTMSFSVKFGQLQCVLTLLSMLLQ